MQGTMYHPLGRMERNFEGEKEYKQILPERIYQFRGYYSEQEEIVLPEKLVNRKCTDVVFAFIFLVFQISLIGFAIYLIASALSPKSPDEKDAFLYGDIVHDYEDSHNKSFQDQGGIDMKAWLLTVLLMPVIALVIMVLLFVGLRWNTTCTFWFLMIFTIVCMAVLAGVCWYLYFKWQNINLLVNAIMGSVFFFLTIGLICCLLTKIELILMTYKEAMIAIFTVPPLLVTPLLTLLGILLTCIVLVSGIVFAVMKGDMSDEALSVCGFLFLFQFYWMIPFVTGSQCIVVAGCVAAYYFTRDKHNIRSPYWNSLWGYIRFHIGTVATGSFIIAVLTMIKTLIRDAMENSEDKNYAAVICALICTCCIECIEEIVEYITRKAYIMTAIHGKPLCVSGKRAMRLLWKNLMDTVAVDVVGMKPLSGAIIVTLMVTVGIGLLGTIDNFKADPYDQPTQFWVNGMLPFFLGVILAMLFATAYLSVLMVAIETIFLCFCEDKEINDGSRSRPYFMSPGLLNVLETAFEHKYGAGQPPPENR